MTLPVVVSAIPTPVELRTSQLLIDTVRGEDETVTFAELTEALHGRAFGITALIFALPACVPMPPGVPTVVGLAIAVVAVQMVMGRDRLWLPSFLAQRAMPRDWLLGALEKARPWLEKVEKFAQPRLLFLTGDLGSRGVGALLLFLAGMLILPIPIIGNFPLAMAAAVLSLGLTERDGRLVLAGVLASAIAVAITGTFAVIAVKAILHIV
jgi:hypothetical protein